ncbi:MAG: hypothetical protein ACI8WB_001384 [Phenylobacterium sp.]|jgi:hypothetical protein
MLAKPTGVNKTAGAGKKSKTKILWALVIIIIALLIWVIDIKFKTIEINSGFSPEAKQNPYLAAQRFLDQTEQHTTEFQRGLKLLDNLPSTSDTIVIASARYSMSQRRTDQLNQWVEQGGQLIVVAKRYWNDDQQKSGDLLLDPLDIVLIEPDYEPEAEPENPEPQVAAEDQLQKTIEQLLSENDDDPVDKCEPYQTPTPVIVDEDQPTITAHIEGWGVLNYPDELETAGWASNGDGVKIVQVDIGQGRITVLTDVSLWNNTHLGCADNAYLLQILAAGTDKTWFLLHQALPGVMTLLWQNHATLVISFLLLLTFWLWSQTLRFGALNRPTSGIRRHFIEHIEASARYQWRSGAGGETITLLRQQILHKVATRHDINTSSPLANEQHQAQCELISRLTDMTTQQVWQALFAPVPDKPEALIQNVSQLQQLRKQLW